MKMKISIFLIITLLVFSVMPVAAKTSSSPKEEVVYGVLSTEGKVKDLYVVNIFDGGSIKDNGEYTGITNLTTTEELSQKGQEISVNTKAGKFYYQGTLKEKSLPWNIQIGYYLDGKKVEASQLGGKSGKLKITIKVKENKELKSSFFESYALQIALSLENKLCSNIKTENATIAEAGSKKQLSYTALPGQGIDATVTADVKDFEMEAISINGIKLAFNIEVNTEEFTKELSKLSDGIKKLDDGAGDLLKGIKEVSTGMDKYTKGMKKYAEGVGQLSTGASQLDNGAKALRKGLSQLTGQNQGMINGAMAIQNATFDSVNKSLQQQGAGLPKLTPSNYSKILSSVPQMKSVKEQLDGVVQFTQGVKSYTSGVAQVHKGAKDLAAGTQQFEASVKTVATSANELYSAGKQLNDGIAKLRDGFVTYKKGTAKMKKSTADMPVQMEKKIQEVLENFTGKGGKIVSFVSKKNTQVSAVQFVLKTEDIQKKEPAKAVPEEEKELGFWGKVLKLFGIK